MARRRGAGRPWYVRAVIVAAAVGVAVFAVEGGEWGTSDLIGQRSRLARLRHDVDSLTRQVDSLKRFRKLLLSDPAVQERIAREEFGMVRGTREMLYRFAEDTTAAKRP